MEQRIRITGHEDNRADARIRKARGWARVLTFVLFGLVLSAIWQEKRLAPPVHDGMQLVAGFAMDYINQNEALSNALVEFQKSYDELTSDS